MEIGVKVQNRRKNGKIAAKKGEKIKVGNRCKLENWLKIVNRCKN